MPDVFCAKCLSFPCSCPLWTPIPTPHRCPVCDGRGNVPYGFYSGQPVGSTTAAPLPEPCRSCAGSGLVWRQP